MHNIFALHSIWTQLHANCRYIRLANKKKTQTFVIFFTKYKFSMETNIIKSIWMYFDSVLVHLLSVAVSLSLSPPKLTTHFIGFIFFYVVLFDFPIFCFDVDFHLIFDFSSSSCLLISFFDLCFSYFFWLVFVFTWLSSLDAIFAAFSWWKIFSVFLRGSNKLNKIICPAFKSLSKNR